MKDQLNSSLKTELLSPLFSCSTRPCSRISAAKEPVVSEHPEQRPAQRWLRTGAAVRLQLGSRGPRKAACMEEEVMQDKNLFLGFLKSL